MIKLNNFKDDIKKQWKCCSECGENNPKFLEFAHSGNEKKELSMRNMRSIAPMEKELKKGRCLCVWCHRLESKLERDVKLKIFRKHEINSNDNDETLIRCVGKICNGAMIPESKFYKSSSWSKTCKNCRNYDSQLKRIISQNYVNEKKIEIGACKICLIKVTPETTCCFDFDHIIRSTKKEYVSRLISLGSSSLIIDKEIAKCQLLCCKCHIIKTQKENTELNQ